MATPFIIDDSTSNDVIYPAAFGRGYHKSQRSLYPVEFAALPSEIPLIPESEWHARCKERKERKSGLKYLRKRRGIQSLDQNGQGYCWMYSCTKGVMLARAAMGLPTVVLSGHSGACKVKNFRDEGGWCGLGAKWIRENGIAPVSHWPEKSMSRAHDTPETWAEAAKYKITFDYADLTKAVYDQNLTRQQIATCLLNDWPVMLDFDEWGHSVCGIDWVEPESGVFVPEIDNSWTPEWGDEGTGLINRRWTVDGAIAIVGVTITEGGV